MECRVMVGKLNFRSIIVRIWQFLRDIWGGKKVNISDINMLFAMPI